MMASQQTKVLDPMYNFDTHFPDRLSRLHLHGEVNNVSFRKKKGRNQRNAARYKTQPVTFDEIKEVDEEPSPSGPGTGGPDTKQNNAELVLGQLQAFSRSMEGLVPRSSVFPEHLGFHISHSRSGSRKFQRHPDCIPEKSETEPVSPEAIGAPVNQPNFGNKQATVSSILTSRAKEPVSNENTPVEKPQSSPVPSSIATLSPPENKPTTRVSPMHSPNITPRRQKVTAKAKKRQKAQSESDAGFET